ncbi:hypothetical protein [Ekhidna sp.]|jgi:hypothetical protein|uniref:hypothetical protein n=1 Tax=Ekhidna sp. TaxID=2608089 RepID=UPI0032F01A15
MAFRRGDKVLVVDVWEDESGSIQRKDRPAIIYDVIGDDHYSILLYGKDRTGKIPGLKVDQFSEEGQKLQLQKDSFLNLSKIIPLKRYAIVRLLRGNCSEKLFEMIEKVIEQEGIEKP